MERPILVTGATGNVGSEVIKILRGQGVSLRAAVTSTASAQRLPMGVDWEIFDFTNPATYAATFANVKAIFLMRPPHLSNIERDMKPAIDAAIAAGVERVVFLSLLGAEKNTIVPHAKVEALLRSAPVSSTLLRAGFFMQNLSTTHLDDIRDHDDLFVPAGQGKTAFIDVRDIAAVAAKTLTEAGHEDRSYALTGSAAYDYAQVAGMMSEELGRPIRYSNPSLPRFMWRMWRRGHPPGYVAVVSAIYTTTRFGMAKTITADTTELLNRDPIPLRQFIRDYAPVWTRK